MKKTLRVAVIGSGFIGRQHIEAIRRIPGTEVLWVVDNQKEYVEQLAEELYIPHATDDYREVLQDERVDIVHNCTPSHLHYEINKAVLEAGKHIYCEKPLTLTAAESEDLCALAKQTGLATGVNFNYRANAMVWEMREQIRQGKSGKPLHVYGEYLQDWLLYKTDFNWRVDESMGGSSRAIADIGSHCFDTAQFVCGQKITKIRADMITVHPVRICPSGKSETFTSGTSEEGTPVEVRSEDIAHINVRFADGTPGLFYLTQVCAGKKNGLALTISGERSALGWEQETADRLWIGHKDAPNQEIYADGGLMQEGAKHLATLPSGHAVAWHDALRNAIGSFYGAIRENTWQDGTPDYADFASAAYVMQLVEACIESARTGNWVEVE